MLSAPTARDIYPCHCEGVRSTLKTLAYNCGNPVQYVCGHSPAVLFYLLDRHALLAMTRGSKGIFLKSLTTPPRWGTPPMEGNWLRTVAGQSSPLRRGGRSPGWSLYPTPPSCSARHPPAPTGCGGHSGVVLSGQKTARQWRALIVCDKQ